ncbi:hypothetical protein Y805_004043 [Salmonella enterica subsp. enterica]|nr:hypothetical protein [Salmonella enterica subsp. enterica]
MSWARPDFSPGVSFLWYVDSAFSRQEDIYYVRYMEVEQGNSPGEGQFCSHAKWHHSIPL